MKILAEYALNPVNCKVFSLSFFSYIRGLDSASFCSYVCSTGRRRAPAVTDRFKWNSYRQTSTRTSSIASSGSATWRGYGPTL